MIKNSGKLLLAAASVALMAGCASTKLDKPVEVEKKDVQTTTTTQQTNPDAGKSTVTTTDQSSKLNAPITLDRVIYFDFDSYAVKDEFRPIVEAHAKLLKENSGAKEVAEGHTDERGGSEYNLALGQKRAEAVVQQMKVLGVGDSQLEAVSYGKERPAVDGHDEAAWAKNRRVELRSK
jgi:peptidoglycan-associated lipoprotein